MRFWGGAALCTLGGLCEKVRLHREVNLTFPAP
jgi:hypothetical protein